MLGVRILNILADRLLTFPITRLKESVGKFVSVVLCVTSVPAVVKSFQKQTLTTEAQRSTESAQRNAFFLQTPESRV